jgi:hypothetical protein
MWVGLCGVLDYVNMSVYTAHKPLGEIQQLSKKDRIFAWLENYFLDSRI